MIGALEQTISIPKTVSYCPSCGFHTKSNGRLEHDRHCPLRGSQQPEEGDVVVPREPTDAMRRAAWAVWPHSDAPYTEIYKAMLIAAEAKC